MSYCRWSSDDWQCDVYVYADVYGGWTTHVAGRRWVFTTPLPPPVPLPPPDNPDADFVAWYERHQIVMRMHGDDQHGHWVDLPDAYAGETFRDSTPNACADRLEQIRAAGFNVPADVITELRAEGLEGPISDL